MPRKDEIILDETVHQLEGGGMLIMRKVKKLKKNNKKVYFKDEELSAEEDKPVYFRKEKKVKKVFKEEEIVEEKPEYVDGLLVYQKKKEIKRTKYDPKKDKVLQRILQKGETEN